MKNITLMKTSEIEYFKKRGLEISKLQRKAPSGVPRDRIESAVKLIYSKIQAGEQIKDVNLARRVWETAKTIEAEQHKSGNELYELIKNLSSKMIIVEAEIAALKISWFKKLFNSISDFLNAPGYDWHKILYKKPYLRLVKDERTRKRNDSIKFAGGSIS